MATKNNIDQPEENPSLKIVKIEIGSKIVTISYREFDEIDVDDLTQIHYENIYGEIVTISTLLNRVGNLKAELENNISEEKLNFDILVAKLNDKLREEITKSLGKAPTNIQVENALIQSEEYLKARRKIDKLVYDKSLIDSLYWSLQSKDKKLDNLSQFIKPEEFEHEIIEGKINDMLIKKFNPIGKTNTK